MQNAKVNIYGIYLCAAQPGLETYRSACEPIYESTAGTEVTVTYGFNAALPTNGMLSLSVGSYTHMALRISGLIQNRVLVQFGRNMSGRSGDGQYWYTSGRDYMKADSRIDFSTIDCAAKLAATEATLDWSAEDSFYICSSGGGAKISSKDWEANTFGKLAAKCLVDLDGNKYTTANIGLGVRQLSDSEKEIFGGNVFYDHEFSGKHPWVGIGLEYLTSSGSLRANHYMCASGEKPYRGVRKKALNGMDLKYSYAFDALYQPVVSYCAFCWTGDGGYKLKGLKAGVSLSFT